MNIDYILGMNKLLKWLPADLAFYACYYLCQQQRVLCLKQTISSSADCPSPGPPAEVQSKLFSAPPHHNLSLAFAANVLCSGQDAPDFPGISGLKSRDKKAALMIRVARKDILWSTGKFDCPDRKYLLGFWMAACWSGASLALLLDRTLFIDDESFIAQVRRCVVCRLPEAFLDILSSWG